MDTFTYKTINQPSKGLYKEKGSKFLSFAFPVTTEDDIKTILDEYKKQYYDARHICFAYVLGHQKDKYRAYDGGEPNHSAGDPILNQIKSVDLSDVLVVVVRYFGGTKLGLGGLTTAYKTVAQEALKQAKIEEKTPMIRLKHHFSYEAMNQVMGVVKEYNLQIIQQQFELTCEIELEVPMYLETEISHRLND